MELNVSGGQRITLGIQHALAMFGATVLVPFLTGLNPSVALATAGIGTLLFHFVTGGKVPVFLGSSFAFIAPIIAVSKSHGPEYATGGIMVAGLIYLALAGLVRVYGVDKVKSFFPPVVAGPMIMVIGLTLAPIAVGENMSATHWPVALITLATVIGVSIYAKGVLKLLPILTGIVVGYIAGIVFGIVDFAPVVASFASPVTVPAFMLPKFSLEAIMVVAPLAIVTMIEHIGDITTNGAVIGKDLVRDPGLDRTLMGDGLATALAGLLGGPANTTYSENTGVLAVTKVYDPAILRVAAVVAILLSLLAPLGALLQTIPGAVMGGVAIVLFGMIASVGARLLIDNRVNMAQSRNLIIAAVILVMGIGGVTLGIGPVKFTGMALGAVVGLVLNKVLPESASESEGAASAAD